MGSEQTHWGDFAMNILEKEDGGLEYVTERSHWQRWMWQALLVLEWQNTHDGQLIDQLTS